MHANAHIAQWSPRDLHLPALPCAPSPRAFANPYSTASGPHRRGPAAHVDANTSQWKRAAFRRAVSIIRSKFAPGVRQIRKRRGSPKSARFVGVQIALQSRRRSHRPTDKAISLSADRRSVALRLVYHNQISSAVFRNSRGIVCVTLLPLAFPPLRVGLDILQVHGRDYRNSCDNSSSTSCQRCALRLPTGLS